jgi:hypothetical protein
MQCARSAQCSWSGACGAGAIGTTDSAFWHVTCAISAVATCCLPPQRSAAGVEPVEQVGNEQLLQFDD